MTFGRQGVTDREAALEIFEQIVRDAPHFIGISDADFTPRFLNAAGRRLVGLDADVDISGLTIADFFGPAEREMIRDVALPAILERGAWQGDCRFNRFDGGESVVMRWSAFTLKDDDGRMIGAATITTDLPEVRKAETQLRESEGRFRRFAENSTDVIWIHNILEDRLEYLSPGALQSWGIAPESAMADPQMWRDSIHPEDRSYATLELEQVISQEETLTREYRIVRPEGDVRWIRDTTFPIRNAEGYVVQVGGIAQDITRPGASVVYVIDVNPRTREARAAILRRAGHQVSAFPTERAFLDVAAALAPGCVLVRADDAAPDRFDLARALKARNILLPVIVEAELGGDVGSAISGMKAGAVELLQAPCETDVMLGAVASALASARDIASETQVAETVREQIAHMSPREREVLGGLLGGGTNKTIARELGISPRTVETHRARVMERLGVRTVTGAVLAAAAAGLKPARQRAPPYLA
jgi:PAS domain S-box-containing protein